MKLAWRLAGVAGALFVLVGTVALVCVVTLKETAGPIRYGVMLDAGSSGTRAYVYSWPAMLPYPHFYPTVQAQPQFLKIKPGLSEQAGKSRNEVVAYLSPLLRFASSLVPQPKRYLTPVFLRATAGLRLLSEADQAALMEDTLVAFQSETRFTQVPDKRAAKVIEGTHEGGYMWIAINYILGRTKVTVGRNATVGVLDCGGASMQIAFVPQDLPTPIPPAYTAPFLDGVYTTSFLLFGKNEARYRLYAALQADPHQWAVPGRADTYYNPCEPAGYSDKSKSRGITLVGTSNATQCLALVLPLLNNTRPCSDPPNCAMQGQYLPRVTTHGPDEWYASDNFAAGKNAVGLVGTLHTPQAVRDAAVVFCALNVTAQAAALPDDLELDDHPCFIAMWTTAIMLEGFAFDPETPVHYVEQIENSDGVFDVSWTLGAMLNEALIFDYPALKPRLEARDSYGTFVAIVALCITILVLGVLLVVLGLVLGRDTGASSPELLHEGQSLLTGESAALAASPLNVAQRPLP